jgi:hypothetical protein
MKKETNTSLLQLFMSSAIFATISSVITFLILKFYFKENYVGWVWVIMFFTIYAILFAFWLLVDLSRKKQNKS